MGEKTILVTGGAGFIGSAFVRRLFDARPEYRILVLDALTYAGNVDNLGPQLLKSGRVEFWYGSVLNGSLVDTLVGRSDAVVHFAAETHVARSIFDDRVFFETDVLGTQTLLSTALKHRGNVERVIHISTSEVYGTALTEMMDEDHPLMPCTPYAAAKAGADRLVYSYWVTYGFPVVILRPFNNYGPHQHLEKVVPRFVTAAIAGEPMTVHGDGSAGRDWVYVDDTVRAVAAAMDAPIDSVAGQVINVGTGVSHTVREIADTIAERFGLAPAAAISYTPERPGQVQSHRADPGKAATLLDFRATVPFDEGLSATVAWYQNNAAWCHPRTWMRHVSVRMPDGSIQQY